MTAAGRRAPAAGPAWCSPPGRGHAGGAALRIPHAALAQMYGVPRVHGHTRRRPGPPAAAGRGYATPGGPPGGTRCPDVFANAAARGISLRLAAARSRSAARTRHGRGQRERRVGPRISSEAGAAVPPDPQHRPARPGLRRAGPLQSGSPADWGCGSGRDQVALPVTAGLPPPASMAMGSSRTWDGRWTPATGACTAIIPVGSASRREARQGAAPEVTGGLGPGPPPPRPRGGSAWSTPSPAANTAAGAALDRAARGPSRDWSGRRLPGADRAAAW